MGIVFLHCPESEKTYVVGVDAHPFHPKDVEERIYRLETRWFERWQRGDTV